MKSFTVSRVVLVFLAVFAWAPACFADQAQDVAAVAAAENFLHLVDAGHYADSWEASANYFQQQVPRPQWVEQLENIRPALGPVLSRTVTSKHDATSLPGAPAGNYVVILFATSFQNQKNSIETVTAMLDQDGKWRVAGYYIQ